MFSLSLSLGLAGQGREDRGIIDLIRTGRVTSRYGGHGRHLLHESVGGYTSPGGRQDDTHKY